MIDVESTLRERGTNYGSFASVATLSQALKDTFDHGVHSKCDDDMREALQMICHKMARIINGNPNHLDSWVDIAGYATLIARRLDNEQRAVNGEGATHG